MLETVYNLTVKTLVLYILFYYKPTSGESTSRKNLGKKSKIIKKLFYSLILDIVEYNCVKENNDEQRLETGC